MSSEFRNNKYFLSNFYECKIKYEGIEYPSVENAYQASKTNDIEKKKEFTNIKPIEAKRLGRQLKIRNDFEKNKKHIMTKLVEIKFNNKDLKLKLINTGDELLEEKNTWGDTYWGTCNGIGENNLGKILMNIRNKHKITEDIRIEIEHIIEKYLKNKGIKFPQDLYYLYTKNENIIDKIKKVYSLDISISNLKDNKNDELNQINKYLKEMNIDIYDEYKCEYVNKIKILNWKRYSLYKNNEEFFYEKKNENKIINIINNDNTNINKMSQYNYELTTVFEEKLKTFFKWAENLYSLNEKDTNTKKNWDFDIINEYKEPYRNKMEKYLENVLQKYNISDSDGDLITTEKDIIIRFKEETEKVKKTKKSDKIENTEKIKKTEKTEKVKKTKKSDKIENTDIIEKSKDINKNSLKCTDLDLYELNNDIDESQCNYLMKLYFSRNELISVFGDLIRYDGQIDDIKFMYKFSMNKNKYVIYTYSENKNDDLWLLGGHIIDKNEHTYQLIELIHFIEKNSRILRIKKLNNETKESLIDIQKNIKNLNKQINTNELSEDEMSEDEMSENEMSENEFENEMSENEFENEMSENENENIDNNVDEKLNKIFKNLKV